MTVVAITPFQHGKEDGEIIIIEVGESIDNLGLSDEKLQEHITNGSAIEVGKDRKFTSPIPDAPVPVVDDATAKRDALLAGQIQDFAEGGEAPNPAASNAVGTLASQAQANAENNVPTTPETVNKA